MSTSELVERLAREAGAFLVRDGFPEHEGAEFDADSKLLRFAQLVAQECADLCEERRKGYSAMDGFSYHAAAAFGLSVAIRERFGLEVE